MRNVVIVSAARTAIGNFGGALSKIPACTLGAAVLKAVLERAALQPEQIDEVILGQVLTAGAGQNPARQAAIKAGLPYTVPSMTINKVCGSGLEAVHLAARAVQCGDADIVIAGGQENMSLAPHILPRSRTGTRMGDWALRDSMIVDGLWDAFNDIHMGVTAENIAAEYKITREVQDRFAARTQQKTAAAIKAGKLAEEIIPIEIPQKRAASIIFDQDEFPKANVTEEELARLRPVFDKEGTVTAANASGINDGAAAVLVMSEDKAKELDITPLAMVKAYASAGVDPKIMGTGPIPATRKCLEKAGWDINELDLIESNEAFAVQAISVDQDIAWDPDKVNVNGGAIALGHPIGASGCRILVTLLYEMKRRDAKRGLATLCIGGGQGVALAVERGVAA